MKITIVMGFFLPMPPAAGGATEKSWHELSLEFARLGHEVTVVSRTWRGWPDAETRDGVRHVRLPGYNHTRSLPRNLALDLLWSLRAGWNLPPADVTVVNCIALPAWLGLFRGRAGRLVVMPGRMPKGQFRLYRRLDLLLAVSTPVLDAVATENPPLRRVAHICGYPIRWDALATPRVGRPLGDAGRTTLGFVGRLHPEKGLDLLVAALARLAARKNLPPWRVLFCGPVSVSEGGGGQPYVEKLQAVLEGALAPGQFEFRPPVFDEARLAEVYRSCDLFCYPSVAARGETFGVAVAEAMAAGAAPVVSALPCFRDYIEHGRNGLVFDHSAADAPGELMEALARLLRNPAERARMAEEARGSVRKYNYPDFAQALLKEFAG